MGHRLGDKDQRHRRVRQLPTEKDRPRFQPQAHPHAGGPGLYTKRPRMTIRYKIQLLFVVLVSAIITLLGISVYYLFALERRESFRAHLRSRASYSAQLYTLLGDSAYARRSNTDPSFSTGYLPRRTIGVYPAGRPPRYQFENHPFDSADRQPIVP